MSGPSLLAGTAAVDVGVGVVGVSVDEDDAGADLDAAPQ
jgi:hypothetical protein